MIGWSDVITAAMQVIDDVRWRDELATNAAQFYRAKSQTVLFALPLLSKPPELLDYLENGLTAPLYGDSVWVSTAESTTEEVTVPTGWIEYDLCTVSLRSADGLSYTPYTDFDYDPETGYVTFGVQPSEGLEYSIDFYTDGTFADLSNTQMRLFALAVAVTWDEHFQRNWLANTAKLHDNSFEPPNEANYMKQTKDRYISNKFAFEEELRAYEQLCAYKSIVGNYGNTVLM